MRRRSGFTIIELLVVVAIIAVLIAILVPTLSSAQVKAQKTKTLAIMNNLASALSSYQQHFGAYPGPASPDYTSGALTPKVNGTANMLGGPLDSTNTFFGGLIGKGSGPVDVSVTKPDGSHEQLLPFFSVSKNSLGTFTTPNLTVLVDAFADPMPILYFRRTPGVDALPTLNPSGSSPPLQGIGGYYLDDNKEFTSQNIFAPTATFLQTTSSWYGTYSKRNAQSLLDFAAVVQNGSGAAATSRGGFLLMCAGTDRVYGNVYNTNATLKTPSDDLVIVGGE